MEVKWLGHACFLITSETGLKILTGFDELWTNPELVQGTGTHRVDTIEFLAIPCYHDKASGRERGENTISCFTVDNIRVCHCGDLGHPLDDSAIRSLAHVNILLIPTGGPPATHELDEAVALWKRK